MAKDPRGQNGKHFSKDYQPATRKKKMGAAKFLAELKAEMPDIVLSKADYFDLLKTLLSGDKEYLQRLAKSENLPVSLLCVINAIKTDLNEGEMRTVNSLIDRMYGKADSCNPTKIEISGEMKPFAIERIYSREQVKKEEDK